MKSDNQSKKPTHNVFTVSGEGDNAIWAKVGAAWSHKDQKGLTQTLNILGLETKLVIREVKSEKEGA